MRQVGVSQSVIPFAAAPFAVAALSTTSAPDAASPPATAAAIFSRTSARSCSALTPRSAMRVRAACARAVPPHAPADRTSAAIPKQTLRDIVRGLLGSERAEVKPGPDSTGRTVHLKFCRKATDGGGHGIQSRSENGVGRSALLGPHRARTPGRTL